MLPLFSREDKPAAVWSDWLAAVVAANHPGAHWSVDHVRKSDTQLGAFISIEQR